MKTPTSPEQILNQLIRHFLSTAATEDDAVWFMKTLASDPELTAFFRSEVLAEITRKAERKGSGDLASRRRKIFRALSGMGVMQAIFGDEYEATKKRLDAESKAARAAAVTNPSPDGHFTSVI